MKTVGIRELKNRLSEYLREVRRGENFLVTDRGEAVAEVSPPYHAATDALLPPGLLALARRGLVTLGAQNTGAVYPALTRTRPAKCSAAELLEDERGVR